MTGLPRWSSYERIAVLVPGIMGSALAYPSASDEQQDVWGDDLLNNYQRLFENPAIFCWTGTPANATLIRRLYLTRRFPWPKLVLWERLANFFQNHREFGTSRVVEFPYDWRAPLTDTALALAKTLSREIRTAVDSPLSAIDSGPRFTLV